MSNNEIQEYVFDVSDLPKITDDIELEKPQHQDNVDVSKKDAKAVRRRATMPDFLNIRGNNSKNSDQDSLELEQVQRDQVEKEKAEQRAKQIENEEREQKKVEHERLEKQRVERERSEREYVAVGAIESDELPDFDMPNSSIESQSSPQLDLSRTLTEDEYVSILEELNEDAENKNYVFLFGIPGSGKSYIIASLLKYMEQSDLGQSRLDLEKSNDLEKRLYNRMIMSFTDPKKYRIESNATLDFNRFNIIFTPKGNKPEKTITFLDISGEACQAIYQGDSSKYAGELPDFLRVVLESDINSTFLLISECQKGQSDDSEVPQDRIIKAFYDKILETQVRESRKYKKILLMSKWDNLPKNEREETDVVEYIQEHLPVTMSNFLAENHGNEILNAVTSYSVGDFRGDRLIKFNEERPRVLFEFLYESISGQPLRKPESQFKKFYRYLMGS